ncbi:MAG: sulfite exporter TauE/SafE family protein [Actinomycetota bacterium]|nr:sulfite exporter TauE/SafE family protein [Actinomycetota bacterium]
MRLVAIGVTAGAFSALFGVGGGIIIVPLLVLAAGFGERPATGTSLAAIGLIALAGTVLYGLRGHVEPGHAALVGLPAALGAVAGAALQQRIGTRVLLLGFAALLALIGVRLLVA